MCQEVVGHGSVNGAQDSPRREGEFVGNGGQCISGQLREEFTISRAQLCKLNCKHFALPASARGYLEASFDLRSYSTARRFARSGNHACHA